MTTDDWTTGPNGDVNTSQLFRKIVADLSSFLQGNHAKYNRRSWLERKLFKRLDDVTWIEESASGAVARIAHKYNLQPKE